MKTSGIIDEAELETHCARTDRLSKYNEARRTYRILRASRILWQ